MAFKRSSVLGPRPPVSALTACMAGIGMNFAVLPDFSANIEDTLMYASEVGMEEGDLRVLGVLTTWLGVHHATINADRLIRIVGAHPSDRVREYWAAIALWLAKDRRFARLLASGDGDPIHLLPTGTSFQLKRRGEDQRFAQSRLRVPAGTLRDRPADVLSPSELVLRHPGYRNRVLIGPSWRADVWTVLEQTPGLSVAEIARRAHCSFGTAWQVVQDFKLIHGTSSPDQRLTAPAASR
jgi:hypothetical protein